MLRRTELYITLLGDTALFSAIFFISWKASEINVSMQNWHALTGNLIILFIWLFLFQSFDLYRSRGHVQIMNEMVRLIRGLFFGLVIIFGIGFLVDIDFIKANGFFPSYLVLLSSVIVWRFFWRGIVGELFKPPREKVLIFQNGDAIEHPEFSVVKKIQLSKFNPKIPAEILKTDGIQGIVIESNGHSTKSIFKIISEFADTQYEIFIAPKLYSLVYNYFLVQNVPESSLLKIVFHPLSTWDRFLKRLIDIFISTLVLIVMFPSMALTALLIKLDSHGPVLYRQKRLGFRGKEFTLYKFRSMVSDAEKHTGPVWARKNDIRITRVGRYMRPLRIDELPQLINVLKGDMSFVGPRPERPAFVEKLRRVIPLYTLRLNVHPGITGLAQVRHRYDTSVESVKHKLRYDLHYINNMSLRMDLKILFKTILTVLKQEGAH
ncbi:sugar transferase [candidate division WOR-3 bacterium]|nr:sugar transferase [candidate division WOR-3 bacterium]